MKAKEIIQTYENDLQEVYKGDLFGEHVLYELIKEAYIAYPMLEEKLYKLIEDNHMAMETSTLQEYINFIEQSDFTIVELYDFQTNDPQTEMIEDILEMLRFFKAWEKHEVDRDLKKLLPHLSVYFKGKVYFNQSSKEFYRAVDVYSKDVKVQLYNILSLVDNNKVETHEPIQFQPLRDMIEFLEKHYMEER